MEYQFTYRFRSAGIRERISGNSALGVIVLIIGLAIGRIPLRFRVENGLCCNYIQLEAK